MKRYQSVYAKNDAPRFSTKVDAYLIKDGKLWGELIGKFDDLCQVLNHMAQNGWEYISHTEDVTNDGDIVNKVYFFQEANP